MPRLQSLPLRRGLLSLCLLLSSPLAVRAQDPTLLVVRQDGGEGVFETISDALDEIPKDPDGPYIIEIRDDGTYEEEVKVNIHSSASATLTIRAGAGNTPSILSDKNNKPALKISSPFVVVEGLILLGGSRSPGLHIDWADDVTVRDCDIHGAKEHDAPGLYVQGAQRVLIEDNLIHDNDVGILVFDAEDGVNTIRNNRIYDNEKRGIWIYKGTANTTVVNNTLYHNKVEIQLGKGNKKNEEAGEGNTFRSNIVVAHQNKGYCVMVSMKDGDSLPTGTVFDYNLYYAEDGGTRVARFRNQDLDELTDWQSAMGVDGSSLESDPLLVAPSADLHPESRAGSYHGGDWTVDANHSPAVDTGDPGAAFADEPDPNGGRINIGAYGNTAEASLATDEISAVPRGEFGAVSQVSDGSGAVSVSIVANHSTGADVQAKIEWSDAQNGTYQAATLAGPVTADVEDSGGPPGLDNGAAYQLGAGADTRIVTSAGSNTVSFTWASATDVPTADGTYWLRLTVTDGEIDQESPALRTLPLDNVAPSGLDNLQVNDLTGTSLTFSWLAVTETNFAGYTLWYGTDQAAVEGRTGSAAPWDEDDDAALSMAATSSTTITGMRRGTQYFAGIWAADAAGNEAGPSLTRSLTAGRDTVFHYVAKSGSDNGVENDPSNPWNSIQRAVKAIPKNVAKQETYYVVEVLDSGRYEEKVTIDRKGDQTYSVTLRAATAQTPTIVGPGNKDALLIKTDYAVVMGFRIEPGNNKTGIIVDNADHVTLLGCIIAGSGSKAGISLKKNEATRIRDVRIDNADTGIHLGDDADNSVISNVLILGDGSRARGVYFDQKTDGNSLVNLSIVGYTRGLSFRGGNKAAGDGHVMRNCILQDVGTCIWLEKPLGNTFELLDYNDLHPEDGGHVGSIEGAGFTTLTDWRNETGLDAHSMSLNPLFADVDARPAAMDLHVASQAGRWDGNGFVADEETSPTIDAGHPRDGFDNETAPNGNRINLGAWGNTSEASRSGGVSLVQGGLPWSRYLLAGVPVIPRDPSPDAVLGDDFPGLLGENIWGRWVRLVRWDTAQNDYVYYEEELGATGSPPDMHPGLGYWLIQWWSIIDEDGNSIGDTVTVEGTLVPSTEDYVIPLQATGDSGFNQVANPFVFDIDWANTRVRDVASGAEVSIAEAAHAEIIDGHAYLWDWDEQAYEPISARDGGRINSWGGFWVEQLDTGRRLELLIPPVEAAESLRKTLQTRPLPTDWFVEFTVEGVSVSLRDPNNRAGVHEDASRRWDPLDALDLTGLRQPYLYVYFPHDDAGDPQTYWPDRPARYTYDIRDPDWQSQEWEFIVDTQAFDTDLRWVWDNPGALPSGYRVALEDAEADTVISADISLTPVVGFSSGPQGMRRFRLRVEFDDILGDVSGDRIVEAQDARQVLGHIVGVESLPDFALAQARVRAPESDADVTPLDAAWILRYAQGFLDALPVPAAALAGPAPAAKALHLSSPVMRRDGTWAFPVYVDDATGLLSGTLQLVYDAEWLTIVDVVPGQDMSGYEGSQAPTADGGTVFVFAGAAPPEGRRVLAQVLVQPLQAGADLADHLSIAAVELNDGQVGATVSAPRPEEVLLYPAAPNPFNSSVTIRFGLPVAAAARLSIYNVLGQRIRVLTDSEWDAGLHSMVWDGRDAAGHDAASGVYMAQLVTGDRKMVQMLALIR